MKNCEKGICLLQLTDLHLFADPKGKLLGVPTIQSFELILETIHKNQHKPDLIVLTGDLSQDESAEAYRLLAKKLSDFNLPCYFVGGNHDNLSTMNMIYPLTPLLSDKQIILDQWQIILLETQKTGCVEGHCSEEQLNFLKKCLENESRSAVVMMHHPAWNVGVSWLDPLKIDNSDIFWKCIKKYSQVKAVISGHVHQEFSQKEQDVFCYSTPSTCIQFKTNANEFALDNQPPGYRILNLLPSAQISTEVFRAPHYVGDFEGDSKGY